MLHCICRTNWHCPIVKTSGMEKTVISTEQWLYLLYVIIHTSPFPFQKWPNAYFIFVQLQDDFFYFAGRIIYMHVHDLFDMTATCALWNGVNYNAYLYAPPSFITTTLSNAFLDYSCWRSVIACKYSTTVSLNTVSATTPDTLCR